ncbi:uncharacterized protein LOC135223795 isoform X1 [Macrobrachium nipponense]|uniref:uncharacterized protein LOC135223795 isoform X1 n=2 Tax=Macrobrachium nipponense TaxID=159736 RepID=UPI0030C8CEA0
MERVRPSSFRRRSSRINWLKKAPHKDPMRLKNLCNSQVTTSLLNALYREGDAICKDFHTMCEMIKTTLPLKVRSEVVHEVSSSQVIEDDCIFIRLLLLHLLTDVQHLSLTTGCQFNLTEEQCKQLLEELATVPWFSLLSLHIEGVTFVKGVLSEIIDRSPRLSSIHVSGDDAASEVLAYITKNPRALHSLHLDTCSVNDLDVVQALIRSYNEGDSCNDLDISAIKDSDIDNDFPPLCHLSVQSPLVTVCGAVVLLHALRNLRTLQYSYWNSSICNLLQYLQMQVPKARPFALTSISLWRVTEKSLDTLKLCPNLQHLMMECTDPSLASMDSLKKLKKLNSLTMRLVPEDLLVSAVRAVGNKLLCLEIEYEEYAKTPIKWSTLRAVRRYCPDLKRLELHHINIIAETGDALMPLFSASLVDLVHLNLSNVVLQPVLLSRLLFKNTSLETVMLDVNQDALTDSVLMSMAKTNNLNQLTQLHLGSGLLSTRAITFFMTLPSMLKISLQLNNFPHITPPVYQNLRNQIANGNFKCSLEIIDKDE